MSSREFTIRICDKCYSLAEGQCHEPACVFIRLMKDEASKLMDTLLIRPICNGEQLDLYPLGTPQDGEKNKSNLD